MDASQITDFILYPNRQKSEVQLSCEDGSTTLPCDEGVRTVFHSSTKGTGDDNPTDPNNLTEQQKKRSVVYTFKNTSCFTMTFFHYCGVSDCSWYGGGNFLFSGDAEQIVSEGECVVTPPAPTLSRTKAPTKDPTMSPTKNPTVNPTIPPTMVPTNEPTKNPTLSPTKNPTLEPTNLPTNEPTKNPTMFPSKKFTMEPTNPPTKEPTNEPTKNPTISPSKNPTPDPTNPLVDPVIPPTQEPTDLATKSLVENAGEMNDDFYYPPLRTCPDDVKLTDTRGVTPFPQDTTSAVRIVSQDTSTVTVQLKQVWSGAVDSIYYQYYQDLFNLKCYKETNVDLNQTYDTIKIQCNVMSPKADLKICLVDNISNGFLRSEDEAVIPKCCHADDSGDVGLICYTLRINCETKCVEDTTVAPRRLLRGGVSSSN